MSNRTVHFSRLLDIISGSALAGATNKITRSALYRDFDTAKLEGKKLRDLIDSNLPTFYVVDCDLIAKETIRTVSSNVGKYIQENEDYAITIIPKLLNSQVDLTKTLVAGLSSNISNIPFAPVISKLNEAYDTLLDTLSNRTSYIGYRNAATLFGTKLRSILKTTSIFIATDGAEIVYGLPNTSLLVIGPTFEGTKRKVNEVLNDLINKFVSDLGISLTKYSKGEGFTVGNIINAGHTSASTESGSLIGINMPMAQEKQFLLAGTGKESGLEDAISDLYLDANYSIKFTQNFTQNATNLLNMQFSFVVSMPSAFNTNELRVNEVSRINEYIGKEILPSIKDQVASKFAGGLLTDLVPDLSASPTISDYIQSLTAQALLGNNLGQVGFQKTSLAQALAKIQLPVIKRIPLNITAKTSPSSVSVNIDTSSNRPDNSVDLQSLQSLLTMNINEQVAKNMGSGDSKTTLNYRSGRFAESVVIDRLTMGRQGMITVYYNYMKYPYQTFEPGYAQGLPTSRDPKLLISKSIREIMSQKVANKFRSVLV